MLTESASSSHRSTVVTKRSTTPAATTAITAATLSHDGAWGCTGSGASVRAETSVEAVMTRPR